MYITLYISDTEYNKMPPMFRLDPYGPCVYEPGGVYCTVELKLVADEPNDLMDMIQVSYYSNLLVIFMVRNGIFYC